MTDFYFFFLLSCMFFVNFLFDRAVLKILYDIHVLQVKMISLD